VNLAHGEGRVGVLDIGSNSIRLVIFESHGRVSLPIFNEKALCGLGAELHSTGRLSKRGRSLAADNIARFMEIAQKMELEHFHIFATAAVRESADGASFAKEFKETFGQPMRVLSGDEEARLSALGVISAFPRADGIVCDLGGGSLELVDVKEGRVRNQTSLPVGSLRFGSFDELNEDEVRNVIDEELTKISWIDSLQDRRLFAIGGAWRSLARLHMDACNYPLKIVHGYSVEASDLLSFLKQLYPINISTKGDNDSEWHIVPATRAEQIPLAALILARILILGKGDEIMFSASGLREGYLFNRLDIESKNIDPLVMSCNDVASESERFFLKNWEIEDWVAAFFPCFSKRHRRLLTASCIIRDFAWSDHPSYRGEQAFLRILSFPSLGLTHQDRVFLALVVLARYRGNIKFAESTQCLQLISLEQQNLAHRIGLVLRLGITISGGIAGVLKQIEVKHHLDIITITYPRHLATAKGHVVERRLKQLEQLLGNRVVLRSQ
tara:strand:+ start:2622 stop:4115 length:1494 start_codon:yes stop_codon:yes gene_type:complete